MKTVLKLLAGALLSASLVACTTDTGAGLSWTGGNPKFTTGPSAPQPIHHR